MTANSTFKISDIMNQRYPSWEDLERLRRADGKAYVEKLAVILYEGILPDEIKARFLDMRSCSINRVDTPILGLTPFSTTVPSHDDKY